MTYSLSLMRAVLRPTAARAATPTDADPESSPAVILARFDALLGYGAEAEGRDCDIATAPRPSGPRIRP